MSEFDMHAYDEERQPRKKSKLAFLLLASRVTTLVSLAISIIILKKSNKTYDDKGEFYGQAYDGYKISYSNYTSYKYMMFIMVVGCLYNLLQIPLAVYYFFKEKHLINHRRFVLFQFFADQVILALLATALGAALGATVDLDKGVRNKEKIENNLHRYWRFMYLPVIFFLIGFLASVMVVLLATAVGATLDLDKHVKNESELEHLKLLLPTLNSDSR